MGFGHSAFKKNVEFLFHAHRRNAIPARDYCKQTVFAAPGPHSRKPNVVYHTLRRLYGEDAKYLEAFSRFGRPGWYRWGDEDDNEVVDG